ncbi:MAG: hypothetical protein KJO11_10490 [Gemmatimonadetes bacterium]|nr:hypothetical protein [Gemmatimonadota bacterium]
MTHPVRLLSGALVAVGLLVLSVDRAAAQTEYLVGISVNQSTGVITVEPEILQVTRGDRIRFVGVGLTSWTVTFPEETPFGNRVITGVAEGGPLQRLVPILPDAEYQSYKYDVSVTVGENTWTVDPEIVVGPPGEAPPTR